MASTTAPTTYRAGPFSWVSMGHSMAHCLHPDRDRPHGGGGPAVGLKDAAVPQRHGNTGLVGGDAAAVGGGVGGAIGGSHPGHEGLRLSGGMLAFYQPKHGTPAGQVGGLLLVGG